MSSSTKKVTIGSRPSKSKAAAAEQWIKTRETAKTTGEDEEMKRMTFDMPESLHKRLKLYCVEHGTKMSIVFRDLVENLLEKRGN